MQFHYNDGILYWSNANLVELTARAENLLTTKFSYKGPYYLYSKKVFRNRFSRFPELLPGKQFFYSVKSLSNQYFLKLLKNEQQFGVDVVSGGELERAVLAGFPGERIVFAGVGKTDQEIQSGIEHNIHAFHIESIEELKNIESIARSMGKTTRISIRINPDVAADTHSHITTGKDENKFGLSRWETMEAATIAVESQYIQLVGLQAHIGSQINDIDPYLKTLDILIEEAREIEKKFSLTLEYLSLGGGFGVDYEAAPEKSNKNEFDISRLASDLQLKYKDLPWKIYFEPGRYISAHSGILIAHVLYKKKKPQFDIAITDAGMGDLLRPALYGAHHPIVPLQKKESYSIMDIAGPICESTDYFDKQIEIGSLERGDTIAILHAGAYGATMGSIYNTRPLIPEVAFTEDGELTVIRAPQKLQDLLRLEEI